MPDITPDMARRELAKRELARRESLSNNSSPMSSTQQQNTFNPMEFNPSFGEKLAPNILAGLMKLGHGIVNAPHDIASFISPKGYLASHIPYEEDYGDPSELLKLPGTISDKTIQGAIEFSPYISSGIGAVKTGASLAKRGMQYLQPDRKAAEFMQKIGGGATSQQNSNDFVELLRYNRHLAEKDALKYKEPVFNALGDSKILPDERFVNALGENKTTQAKGYFLSEAKTKNYSESTKEKYNIYKENPTLHNADQLQQSLGKEIGDLNDALKKGDTGVRSKLDKLTKDRNNIIQDQISYMNTQDPAHQLAYNLFRKKWVENVRPYEDSTLLSEMSKTGPREGYTQAEIRRLFKDPVPDVQTVMEHLGESGKNKILYNEIQSEEPKKAAQLAKDLSKAKQFGYEKNITPDMEALSKELSKRSTISEIAKGIGKTGLGYAGGDILGHPYLGALLGLGWAGGRKGIEAVLKHKK